MTNLESFLSLLQDAQKLALESWSMPNILQPGAVKEWSDLQRKFKTTTARMNSKNYLNAIRDQNDAIVFRMADIARKSIDARNEAYEIAGIPYPSAE